MRHSRGYSAEDDMGNDKDVVVLSIVETSLNVFRIAYNGRVLGDSRGMRKHEAEREIADMCDSLYCCVKYVAA